MTDSPLMVEFVAVIQRYALWLYVLLGAFIVQQFYTIWRAAREHGTSLFGLEREAATGKAMRALVTLMLFCTIAAGVYTVQTVVAPAMRSGPGETTDAPQRRRNALEIPPPTVDLPTDTATPPAETATPEPIRIITSTPVG